MINIKNLTVKNFMSVGNVTQAIDFDKTNLTLVLGENLDLGGDDAGARNGTGKTTIINALSFALFGQALTNIKKDNLINKTNGKTMMVTCEFEKSGINYRIERGRKPTFLKYYINDQEQNTDDHNDDESQGDSRETQEAIESNLGFSHTMFKHIVALNTYTEPFLNMKAADQRDTIEQLLGITILSQKAEALKELNKAVKDNITQEEFRIKAVQDANTRVQEQIEALKRRQTLWLNKHQEDVNKLSAAIEQLKNIDVEAEIQAHKDLESYHAKKKQLDDLNKWITSIDLDDSKLNKLLDKLKKELGSLEDHKCYACGHELHDTQQDEIKKAKESALQETALQLLSNDTQRLEHQDKIKELGALGAAPEVFYDKYEDALEHKNTLANLKQQLTAKEQEQDPYAEQIDEMKSQALETIDYSIINDLIKLREHQQFLLNLLTSKDSFVRKRIIDQNLSYLNQRLAYYLDRVGLPHTVKFLNDLSVEISELGRELDFDNLSRGERNRLILSLSWAFRDVWESLYHPINLLFIDELIDSGMDSMGVENGIGVLKKMSRERDKSIFLISHRDELITRVNNVLTVTKENGFTTYSSDVTVNSV
jgi:DNA repair exonuclease SbcCD ATPase subunit